jgi:CRP-like cAMP-binding protein
MANRSQTPLTPGNRLLSTLPPDELARLQEHLEPVKLRKNQVLVVPGDEVRYGYFPVDGIISMLMILEDGTPVEVANIGNEGFADSASILSIATSPFEIMAQGPGHALRITIEALRQEFRGGGVLREQLLRFCGVVLTITGRSLACNVTHTPEQRLAKWLMLARDRTIGDDLPYTQESLARILGVRRPTVTEAAAALKNRGLIEYHRGHIRVIDRAGLQEAACADYQAFIDEYERLLGPAPAYGRGDNRSGA